MSDRTTEIARLEAILNSGATSVSVDGQTVTHDLAAVRRRLEELRAEDDTATVQRPLAVRCKLGAING